MIPFQAPKMLFSEQQIQEKVCAMADKLNRQFQGEVPVFICILKGASVFFSDIIRNLNFDIECDFFSVSSYKKGKSTGQVKILSDLSTEVRGRSVVLIEDIVDSGLTVHCLQNLLKTRGIKDLTTVALIYKPSATKNQCELDHVGFEIKNEFVVGYGMDYENQYRNIPYIGVISHV